MIELLKQRPGERKLRLFACACCRGIADLLTGSALAAVEDAERFAEGLLD